MLATRNANAPKAFEAMAEHRHLGKPNPEWIDFPNNLPKGTKHQWMSRDKRPIEPQSGLDIAEIEIPVRDGTKIAARYYRQIHMSEALPVFVYMHGGGYVTGSLETDDTSCRALALAIPVVVLSIDYRLAPEHKFPIGFQDSHDALRWVTSEEAIEILNIDPVRGFILGGTSAGGNFTAGIAHLIREEHLPHRLTGLVFLCPSFCHPDARPEKYRERILSVDEIDDAPGLTRKSIDYFANLYGAPPDDTRLSPLLFESHARLADKAFFAVCGWDPRRDEALLFEELLREAGLQTKVQTYQGLPHGFWTTCPELPVSREWERDFIEGVRWLLN